MLTPMENALPANDFFTVSAAASGVSHLQMNRPERLNTLAPAFFPALRDAVLALNAAGQTRALVISSTGRHFSAGMALSAGALFCTVAGYFALQPMMPLARAGP